MRTSREDKSKQSLGIAGHSQSTRVALFKFDRCAARMCKILSEPFSGVYLVADQSDQRDAGTLIRAQSKVQLVAKRMTVGQTALV
jgi:hypothetical protein